MVTHELGRSLEKRANPSHLAHQGGAQKSKEVLGLVDYHVWAPPEVFEAPVALANSVGPENPLRLQHLEQLPALVNANL